MLCLDMMRAKNYINVLRSCTTAWGVYSAASPQEKEAKHGFQKIYGRLNDCRNDTGRYGWFVYDEYGHR